MDVVSPTPPLALPSAALLEHLVQVPTIIRSWSEASEPPRIAVPELEDPTTHSLVRGVEAPFGQQILDVSEAQRETAIEPHGMLNNMGRKSVAAVEDRFHRPRPIRRPQSCKLVNLTAPPRKRLRFRPSSADCAFMYGRDARRLLLGSSVCISKALQERD